MFQTQVGRVTEACRAIDRDPSTMTWSAALVLCCGRDEAEIAKRAGRIGREVDELRANGAAGTPDEVLAKLRSFGDAGATRVLAKSCENGEGVRGRILSGDFVRLVVRNRPDVFEAFSEAYADDPVLGAYCAHRPELSTISPPTG